MGDKVGETCTWPHGIVGERTHFEDQYVARKTSALADFQLRHVASGE